MTQQQTQSPSSQSESQAQTQAQTQVQSAQDPSLARPKAPDATSPYSGPADEAAPAKRPEQVDDPEGPRQMAQPSFSEAQSTLGAFEPAERPGDPSAQPEDARGDLGSASPERRAEQPAATPQPHALGAAFATSAGTVRAGMTVVDSYGHMLGTVAGVDGERLRLASADPHDDGAAFLAVSLIAGIDGDRVLLAGRGDASFGMPTD